MSSEAARPPGQLLILSAPSGAGKTTLARRFQAGHEDALFSVSVTTRAPRGAERDGIDYQFVTRERFDALVAEGAFAEWAAVHGHRYGTLRQAVSTALAAGRIALFDIDVQGGEQLKAAFPHQATTILILPSDPADLERRLRGRSTDGDDAIRQRLAAARAEVARGLASYEFVVINDELETALARLTAIATSVRARLAGRVDPAVDLVARACRREAVALEGWKLAEGA